jgi:hypothetical protein
MPTETNIKVGLVGLTVAVMMMIVVWQGQTAVSANGQLAVYLPHVYKNFDGTLKAPIFGLQVYGSTTQNSLLHPYILESTASWLRVPAEWYMAEPNDITPAVYSWGAIDGRLAAARHDVANMNMIATIDAAPDWVTSAPNGPIPAQYLDDFADFVGAMVERFDGDGFNDAPGSPVVLYWEFYNEPDNNSDVQGNPNYTPPTHWGDHGTEYANMLMAVYPVIKAANPQAKVVFGGVAMDWFEDNGGPFAESFLDDVLAAGGGDYFDVMNFHSYPAFNNEWTDNEGPGLLEKTTHVRTILQNAGYNKPIIITETGWFSNEQPGSPVTGSPEIQSRYVVELFTQSMAADLDVMIWWLLVDSPFPYPYRNGLITNDPVPVKKMSFSVYQDAVYKLSTAHFVRALSINEMGNSLMEAYEFRDNVDNQTLYVVWLNPVATTATVPLLLPVNQAIVRDSLTGFAIFIQDGHDGIVDGRITVQVGANPIYVESSE